MHPHLPRTSTALGTRGGQHYELLHILKASPWYHWHPLISAVGHLPLWYEDCYSHAQQHIRTVCVTVTVVYSNTYICITVQYMYNALISVHTYYNMCVCVQVRTMHWMLHHAQTSILVLYTLVCVHSYCTLHMNKHRHTYVHTLSLIVQCTYIVCICTAYSVEKPPHDGKVSKVAFKMARAMSKVSQPSHWNPFPQWPVSTSHFVSLCNVELAVAH